MATQHLVLVPGFFGFVNFGPLVYFAHVRDLLEREFQAQNAKVLVHRVRTHPVSSLRQRARDLRDALVDLPDDGPIHIVGHSTGGLDGRLVTSPGVALGGDEAALEGCAQRVRSVISICTPHRGSPLADHFVGLIGEPLLRSVSILTALVLRHGRLPARLALRFARALIGEQLLPNTPVHLVLDTLEHEAEAALRARCTSEDERLSVAEFMRELRATPHLIPQLMPPTLDVFNAGVRERDTVEYGCVIARCPAPSLTTQWRVIGGPYEHATHAFFQWLWRRAAPLPEEFAVPTTPDQDEAMRAAWGEIATVEDNDGMVPTRSQIHGRIVHAATADHLDVIGHLEEREHLPPTGSLRAPALVGIASKPCGATSRRPFSTRANNPTKIRLNGSLPLAPTTKTHVSGSFGAHVKRLREVRRLTQEELAERSDLAPDTIRRLEHQDFSPSLRTLRKVCKGLGLSVSAMFNSFELETQPESLARIHGLLVGRSPAELKLAERVLFELFAGLEPARSEADPKRTSKSE